MTISTTNNKKNYSGLTGNDTFAYDFRVDVKDDMEVYFDDVLQPDGDWTITNLGEAAGGNVVLNTPLAADTAVTLLRNVAVTQGVDYRNGDAFPAETHEGALDKLTMIAQQLDERTARAILLPLSEESYDTRIPFYNGSNFDAVAELIYDKDATTGPQLKLIGNSAITTGQVFQLVNATGDAQAFAILVSQAAAKGLQVYQSVPGGNSLLLDIDRASSIGSGFMARFNNANDSHMDTIEVLNPNVTDKGQSPIKTNGFDAGPSQSVVTTSDQANSTTTPVDDDTLKFYAEANSVYHVEAYVRFTVGDGVMGVELGCTNLSGARISGRSVMVVTSSSINTDEQWFAPSSAAFAAGHSNPIVAGNNFAHVSIRVQTNATAGEIALRFAQRVTGTGSVTRKDGSSLTAIRIGAHA